MRCDPNPQSIPTLRAAGNPTHNPTESEGLDYFDSEEQSRRNLYGTQPILVEVLPQEAEVKAGAVPLKGMEDFSGPKFLETVELNKRLASEPKLLFLKDASPHLSSYVRARVYHYSREGEEDVGGK